MRPWVRNLLFLMACTGVGLVLTSRLLRREPLPAPPQHDAQAFASRTFIGAVERLDAAFSNAWTTSHQPAAPQASRLALLRRLSLGLTGTVPALEEIRAVESVDEKDWVQWWLSRLLVDRRFSDHFAERVARAVVGVEGGPFILYRRHRLVSWLSDQIQINRPFDEVMREMITAEGIWTSRPAVNFITVTVDQNNDKEGPDEQKLAARVSRAFLGQRIDCVQCHDDMFGDRWKQKDFHQLAAFFVGSELSLTGVRDQPGKAYEYRYLGRSEKEPVPAKVPFHAHLLPAEGALRHRLATWVTHDENKPFARMMVNRVWALMFGRPLHRPIDDLPLNGPFPPGMEVLADEWVASGHDLHRLIRLIAASRVFQRDSRPAGEGQTEAEETGYLFASFPVTRLRPEQVGSSVLQASSLRTQDSETPVFRRVIRFFQQNDFVTRYGDAGEDEFGELPGTIPQRLVMMNGKLVHERTKEDLVMNASTRIGALARSPRDQVELAYLTLLTRRPTSDEAIYFENRLRSVEGVKKADQMEDLCWALINSTEFSWNH